MKKIFTWIILAVLSGITSQFANAQTTPSGIPIAELEQFVNDFAQEKIGVNTIGAQVAIVKDGQLIVNSVFGYAIQGERKATIDDVFEWGSATKLLIWVSVSQLLEQGLIDLNTDIRDYLPSNFFRRIRFDAPITMLHLMNHNAGWEDRFVNLFLTNPNRITNLEDAIRAWEPKQIYAPGTITAYSNYGTAIAGLIVERISGIPFHQYVMEHIFMPLGMFNTSIHPTQQDNPSVAEKREKIKGYVGSNGNFSVMPTERIFIPLYPAGSVIGTSRDAIKFLNALMPAEGETSPLFNSNSTLNQMLTPSFRLKENFPGFAHGFIENFYSIKTVGHGGNTAAFSALFTFCPDERLGVVIMANQAQESAMCYMLTMKIFGRYEGTGPTEGFIDANTLTGMYYWARRPVTGFASLFNSLMIFPIRATDENTLNLMGSTLTQVSPGVFRNDGGFALLDIINLVGFEVVDGDVQRLSVVVFDLLPASTWRPIIIFGSALCFGFVVLFSVVAFFITIVGFIKRKVKKRQWSLIKKINATMSLSLFLIVLNNVILLARGFSFAAYSTLMVHFVLNIIYMIVVPVGIVFMIKNFKIERSKGGKVLDVMVIAFSLIFAVILLGWEFWR
ncbi:MAG: beta-lactamase family protein [Bacteroidales bacterium]|nr:beta-lactamase family protein [Bacteroidales bacterium]